MIRSAATLLATASLPIAAQELVGEPTIPRDLRPVDIVSFIDATSLNATLTPGIGLEGLAGGELDYFQSSLTTFFSPPVEFTENLVWVPMFRYEFTELDPSGTALGPLTGIFDHSLHQLSIANAIVYDTHSRWYHGLYLEPGLFSDFEQVDSRDFFLSAALASAYRVNDCLLVGVGVYGSDLTNDPWFIGGPGFVWTPDENWLITYYGPRFIARRELGDNLRLGVEAGWNGGKWNIEHRREAYKLEVDSFRVGALAKQRIYGELWAEFAVGYTFTNEVTLSTPGGTEVRPDLLGEADSAPYFSLTLSVNRW